MKWPNGRLAAAAIPALVALAVLDAPVQGQVTLRWKFQQGQKLNYTMQQKMDMKMDFQGRSLQTTMTQTTDLAWEVQGVESDGAASVAQTIKRMRYRMEGPPPINVVEYDSAGEQAPSGPIAQVLAPVFQSLVGGQFLVKMDPRGTVSDMKLPEEFAKTLKNMPGASRMGFSEERMRRMVGQGTITFPEKNVSQGDTWDHQVELNMPFGTMKVHNTYKYLGPEQLDGKPVEKIGVTTKVSVEPKPDAQFTLDVQSLDSKGAIFFDNAAGHIVQSELKQNMVMKVEAGDDSIEQTIAQAVSMKLAGEKQQQ